MSLLFFYLTLFVLSVFGSAQDLPDSISVGKGSQRTLHFTGLSRVAVGNSKILRVKALPPASLLLTGLSLGKTSVSLWNERQEERVVAVSVVPIESLGSSELNPRGQVAKVALQFLELNETVGRSSGFQWPDTLTFSGNAAFQSAETGVNYALTVSTANGFLNLLVKEGWAKILASPELYVRLGEQAVFHSGGEFPVTTGTDSFIRYQRRIEWKKYGLTATVKPDSPDQIHFQSDIQIEISELDPSYQVDNIPALTARKLITKIDSLDGQTVILSGLIRQASQSEDQKVPWLSAIPLLGNFLFTRTSTGRKETEILMAVTIGMTSNAIESDRVETFHRRLDRIHD